MTIARRKLLAAFAGAAAWPLAARGQQPERMRRIGILTNLAADDPEGRARVGALIQGLTALGWREGSTLQVEIRGGGDDPESSRKHAIELLALGPDALVATTTAKVDLLRQITHTLPIVFAGVSDPVGAGLVASLARPGGNITGFALPEYGISVKWLELLKEIAPDVTQIGVLSNFGSTPGVGQLAALQGVAPSIRVELKPLVVGDANGIEANVRAFAATPKGGLIVTTGTVLQANRKLVIALAARYGLPAVYPFRPYVTDGGLLFYGADLVDQFRRAADYVDRILKGEKPADLPVQAPTKYELVVNVKTAKTLGLDVPPTLLARADEIIE